jgi:hypothetical protein
MALSSKEAVVLAFRANLADVASPVGQQRRPKTTPPETTSRREER